MNKGFNWEVRPRLAHIFPIEARIQTFWAWNSRFFDEKFTIYAPFGKFYGKKKMFFAENVKTIIGGSIKESSSTNLGV